MHASSHFLNMKKILFRMALAVVVIIVVVVAVVAVFFATAPQIGGNPQGQRLERLKASPNFENGIFKNTIETPMDMPLGTLWGVMGKFLFGFEGAEPKEAIRALPFDKQQFAQFDTSQVAFSWLGHSSVLLRIEGKTLLIDPVFGERASMFPFMGPKHFPYDNRPGVEAMPDKLDAILISHDHYDHLDYPSIQALKARCSRFLVPLGVGAHLEAWGIPASQIQEMDWWEETRIEGLQIAFTPSRHFSGRGLNNRFSTLWGSWCFIGRQRRVFFSGDSGYTPEFAKIGQQYGPFDIAMMECGQYNEAWKSIHMMPEESVQACQDVRAQWLMPIHWGKFQLAIHDWKEPVQRLTKEAEAKGVQCALPEIGSTLVLGGTLPQAKWWESYR
jgi:L-ascorbate metabolism protein UlaG (beta-lactamase superfamily)